MDDKTKITYSGATVGGIMGNDNDYNITIDTDSLQNDDGTFTIDTSSWDDTTSFTPTFDVSPQDNWPSEYQVEQMIEIYPALKLQYEQFIKIYNMVKDDYNGRKKLDDDVPF